MPSAAVVFSKLILVASVVQVPRIGGESLVQFSLKDVSPKVSNMNLGYLLSVEEVS